MTAYRLFALSAALSCLLFPNLAQSASVDTASTPLKLDPFQVTAAPEGYAATDSVAATRIAVPLVDLPINVSIANAELMREAQVLDVIDVLRYKGINANRDIRFNSMFIRGFNNTLQKRNGVARRYNWQTTNLEQVEIVKGPASILYGSVLPGGAVMSVSSKPQPQRHLDTTFTIGSYDFLRGVVDLGGPFSSNSKSGFRLIAERQDSEDYYLDTFVERNLVNPIVRLELTDRIRVDLEYEYIRHAEHQTNYQAYYNANTIATQPPYPGTPQALPLFPAHGFSWGFLDLPEKNHNSAPGSEVALDTDWYEATTTVALTRDWTLRWLFNYNEAKNRTRSAAAGSLPYSGGQYVNFRPAVSRSEFEALTTFVEATGRMQWGGVRLIPLFGAEYSESTDLTYTWSNPPPNEVIRIDEIHRSNVLTQLATPVFVRRPDTTREQQAVYGIVQAELLQERLRLLAGLRYEEGETNPLQQGVGPGNAFDAFSTQLGVVWRFNREWVSFLNLSESFVPSTIVNPDGSTLPLEKGRGQELGVRWIQPNGKLAVTATVFHTIRDDMARLDTGRTFDEINNPQRLQYFTTSGEEEVYGAELELYARPFAWWDFTFNYNWLPHAEVVSFPNRPDIEGNRLRYAPRHGVALWSKVWLRGSREGFFLFGGATHQSETEWDSDKQFTTIVFKSWTNVDLGVGWEGNLYGKHCRFELLGKNLSDNELTTTYRPQDRRKFYFTTTVNF